MLTPRWQTWQPPTTKTAAALASCNVVGPRQLALLHLPAAALRKRLVCKGKGRRRPHAGRWQATALAAKGAAAVASCIVVRPMQLEVPHLPVAALRAQVVL